MTDSQHKNTGRIHSHQQEASSSSQCPQCHQKYTEAASSSSESQSVSDHAIIPLRKHMIATNDGIAQFQKQLSRLERQIQVLKRDNIQKDLIIQQLRKTLTRYKLNNDNDNDFDEKEQLYQKIIQNKKDIKNLKEKVRDLSKMKDHDLGQNRKIKNIKSLSNLYTSEKKKGSVKQKLIYEDDGINGQYYGNYNPNKNRNIGRNLTKTPRYPQNKVEQLEHQDIEQRVFYLQESNKWMTNFIYAFIQMAQGFSEQYRQQIFASSWDLKKRAKVAWRYLKHLIKFWLSQD